MTKNYKFSKLEEKIYNNYSEILVLELNLFLSSDRKQFSNNPNKYFLLFNEKCNSFKDKKLFIYGIFKLSYPKNWIPA